MAIQLLSDITATVTTPASTDLMLLENAGAHKKLTYDNLRKTLLQGGNGEVAVLAGTGQLQGLGDLTWAANVLTLNNADAGGSGDFCTVQADSDETNVDLRLYSKGTGNVISNAGLSVSGVTNQLVNVVHRQLSQAEIQSLGTTPIEIIPAPGANKIIQVFGGLAYLNHNGTSYSAGFAAINFKFGTVGNWSTGGSFVDAGGDKAVEIYNINDASSTPANIAINTPLNAQGNANPTENGGTIDIYLQYVIIDLT